jgi:hypothetical protein
MIYRPLYEYPADQMIRHLELRGYIVRHSSEARRPLSWNRTLPFPHGVNFELEALEKIREQIKPEHLTIETHALHGSPHVNLPDRVQTALLRILY